MVGRGSTLVFVLASGILSCKRSADPVVIRSDPAKPLPSASTALAIPPASAEPSASSVVGFVASALGDTDAGPADPSASAVIARHRFRFKQCFNKELASDPKAGGKIVVKVEIAANGDMKGAVPVSTTASKGLTDCVVRAFGSMQFEPSDAGSTTILVPIVLTGSP